MSTYTRTRQWFDEQVCYPHDLPRPDLHKVKRSPPVAGPLQIKIALSSHPDPTWTAGRDFAIENGRNAGG